MLVGFVNGELLIFESSNMEQPIVHVQAKYEYEYKTGDGMPAKMFPGDQFTLIRKSNSDWWYVKRDGELRPVYLPATYLESVPDNAVIGLGNLTQHSGSLIPHARVEAAPAPERSQTVPSGTAASQIRHNNMLSEISDRLRSRVTIPQPDYDNVQEQMQHKRPTQLNVKDGNGRQGVAKVFTPVGGAMSPMTDSEPSSYSEQSSVNSPDNFPPPPKETSLPSHFSNSNLTRTSQTLPTVADKWQIHTDEKGRKFYYNPSTNATAWEPPPSWKKRSQSVSPKISKKTNSTLQPLPPGWREEKTPAGGDVFINDQFKEKWYKSQNDQGETYYYSGDREESGWNLPTEPSSIRRRKSEESADSEIQRRSKGRGNNERASKTKSVFLPSKSQCAMNVQRRHSEIEQDDIHPETASSEREGYLQYVRPGEATRKNKWQTIYTAVTGSTLTFYKDVKSKSGPPIILNLWGSQVVFHSAKQSKNLKKNYIELRTPTDKEYWLQADSEDETSLWYTAICSAVRSMPPASQRPLRRQNSADDAYSSSNDRVSLRSVSPTLVAQRSTSPRPRPEHLIEISKSRADKKKIKNKLKSFITKRPTIESLQKQGIMKEEDVFGRRIQALCQQQGTLVPRFVVDCIAVIDKSGLKVDGIYRVSGNLSLIQKLRFLVDQDKPVDFSSSPWKEDIHVIAGALKLYFRELPEPLVTFDGYDRLMKAMIKPPEPKDGKAKLQAFHEVISSLPHVNQETMKVLFRHLNRVVEQKEHNRMLPQNLAIVFGPTLMWPKKECYNIATSMVCQNQCIEFIINHHQQLFK